jgi:pre-mRNA-processing factor 40
MMARYSALKSLGEKKATFNEYLQQRKKEEATMQRQKAKKARDELTAMLEESDELKPGTRFSAAMKLFEDDERWLVWPLCCGPRAPFLTLVS